jgi:hypothetical protein
MRSRFERSEIVGKATSFASISRGVYRGGDEDAVVMAAE